MAQQTAILYIEDNLIKVKEGHHYIVLGGEEYINVKHIKSIVQQAKAMEKEQIVEAYFWGDCGYSDDEIQQKMAEQYYNETYNK